MEAARLSHRFPLFGDKEVDIAYFGSRLSQKSVCQHTTVWVEKDSFDSEKEIEFPTKNLDTLL
jgi:hypothetical protein